VKNTDYVR